MDAPLWDCTILEHREVNYAEMHRRILTQYGKKSSMTKQSLGMDRKVYSGEEQM